MSVQNTIGVRTLCPCEDILRISMSMCCSLFPFAVLSEPSLCAAVELCVCVCTCVYVPVKYTYWGILKKNTTVVGVFLHFPYSEMECLVSRFKS